MKECNIQNIINFLLYILLIDFYYCYDLIYDKVLEINKIMKQRNCFRKKIVLFMRYNKYKKICAKNKYKKLVIKTHYGINTIQKNLQSCVNSKVNNLLLHNPTIDRQASNYTIQESELEHATTITIKLCGNIYKRYPYYVKHVLSQFKADLLKISYLLQQ